ncbi:MAG TPA: choice-of-anchor J domain-containing protein [Ignavibacteriaceae bacterium]|nr:choice-of-anchor J domain-containing protein [Ignavibacteriaceae bacterium]
MKKILLTLLIFFDSLSFIAAQNIREVDLAKEKIIKRLPIPLSKLNKVSVSAFSESFEDATFPPQGWFSVNNGGSGWSRESAGSELPGWGGSGTISTPPGGGNFTAYCTFNQSTPSNNQWLISPQVQNIQPGDRLFFWMRKQQNFADTVYLYYSLDGASFNFMGEVSYAANSDTNWGLWFTPIGDIITAGSNVYFGFQEYVSDNNTNGAAISLDLVFTVSYPANIAINNNFTFGDPTNSSGYRMISLPGITNRLANTGIPGEQRKDYNIFDDNGAETGTFLVEFNGTSDFNFKAGKGFWILSKNPFNVNLNVNSVPVEGGNFELPLHNGWNIIADPFEKNISWTNVQNVNGIADPINLFEGTYSQPNIMEPYNGYYYFNRDNRASLIIPYNYTQNLGKQNGGPGDKNSIKISLLIDNNEKSNAKISINNESNNGCDRYDIFAPPGNFAETDINIYNDLLPSYKYLMIDCRKEIGEGQSYDLKVKIPPGKLSSLQIDGIEKFPDNEIYLLDLRSKKSYNLKILSKIEINSFHENNDFRLLIGSAEYIDKTRLSELPSEFRLYKNYPNPFNPSTVISFDLPRNQNLNLFIYNILGERIKTLFSGNLEAGRYEFKWDGTNELNVDVSSGIYIYSLEGSGFKAAQKMILER